MPRYLVFATMLAVAAAAWAVPALWALSQSYLNAGHGLHPFLCGAASVALAGIALALVGTLLNHPGR